MNQKFRPIGLTPIASGVGYNSKKGYAEASRFLRSGSRAVDVLTKRWDQDLQPFIDLVPSTSDINPFTMGLTAETLFLDSNATDSHPFYWNGLRSKTVFEALDELRQDALSIQKDLERLQADVAKITSLNVKRRFSQFPDTPTNYFHTQYIRVKADESGLEPTTVLVANNEFTGLQDTPDTYQNSGGDLVVTKTDQSGVQFIDEETVRSYSVNRLVLPGPFVLGQYDVAGALIYVPRDVVADDIFLQETFHGAEVIFRSIDPVGAPMRIQGYPSLTTVENEPLELNDTRKFLHLVYDTSTTSYLVVGYH
jgi:hypothetical protein